MLRHTFCHISGLGVKTEAKLWDCGILDWDHALAAEELPLKSHRCSLLKQSLEESLERHAQADALYFDQLLSASESWRLYAEFKDCAAYVDIETTGGYQGQDHITTIALWDGRKARHYVYGRNIEDFLDDILRYKLVVTFNGRCFDVPVLEKYFNTRLPLAHLDLRFALKSAGIAGGLKKVEKHFGLTRGLLDGVDGYWAVLLWHYYETTGNKGALNTLLAYNMEDVLSLEVLAAHAYNLLASQTPFGNNLELPIPQPGWNPFTPDPEVLERIQGRIGRRY